MGAYQLWLISTLPQVEQLLLIPPGSQFRRSTSKKAWRVQTYQQISYIYLTFLVLYYYVKFFIQYSFIIIFPSLKLLQIFNSLLTQIHVLSYSEKQQKPVRQKNKTKKHVQKKMNLLCVDSWA